MFELIVAKRSLVTDHFKKTCLYPSQQPIKESSQQQQNTETICCFPFKTAVKTLVSKIVNKLIHKKNGQTDPKAKVDM